MKIMCMFQNILIFDAAMYIVQIWNLVLAGITKPYLITVDFVYLSQTGNPFA